MLTTESKDIDKDALKTFCDGKGNQKTKQRDQKSSAGQTQSSEKKIIVKLWILWYLETVYHHRSYTSAGNNGDLFREIFLDFYIAQSFGQQYKQKIAYIISHGLAPCFKKCQWKNFLRLDLSQLHFS